MAFPSAEELEDLKKVKIDQGAFPGDLQEKVDSIITKLKEKHLKESEDDTSDYGGTDTSPPLLTLSFDDVKQRFEEFKNLDPSRYDAIVDNLNAALEKLCDDEMLMGEVDGYLDDWSGESATAFKENVLAPHPNIIKRQQELTVELLSAAKASQELTRRAQIDIVRIVLAAEAAIEGKSCNNGDLKKVLAVIGAIVAGLALAAGVPAVGAAAAALMGGSSLGLGLVKEVGGAVAEFRGEGEAPPVSISGTQSGEIAKSIVETIDKLKDEIKFEEEQVKEVLKEDAELIKNGPSTKDDKGHPKRVELPKPKNPITSASLRPE